MIDCFEYGGRAAAIPVTIISPSSFKAASKKYSAPHSRWLEQNGFTGKSGDLCALPDGKGNVEKHLFSIANIDDPFALADLPKRLPRGLYSLEGTGIKARFDSLAIGWGIGCYRFDRYRKNSDQPSAKLKLSKASDHRRIQETVSSVFTVRDLINTPAEDMMPQHLSAVVSELAQTHEARFTEIVGDELLAENYPCIHAVGRASVHPPRLLELRWGQHSKHPLVTIVGKGISFDSGGLDIKPAAGMRNMKKDMGGAAHAIGLAQMVMALELPVNLRLLIATAENAISSNAYRPGDVIRTRAGLSVEIENTDAEGRLVMCDALSDACDEAPDLLIDFSTLTGAARVAVGTEIAAFFSNDQELAGMVREAGVSTGDPTWELPLHSGYDNLLKSHVADLQNAASTPFGGAITAALYLQKFVDPKVRWLHFDIMAWNTRARRGRPIGGEAMGVRAMFETLEKLFG